MSAAVMNPMVPLPYLIRKVRRETGDTFTLALEPVHAANGFTFAPGQFNMLYTFGVGEVAISISGDPSTLGLLCHTIRAVGTVTNAIRELKRGAILGLRGPFGSHWPVEEARGNDVLLVAGGTGLAPLRPALYHLLAHRDEYGRIALLYGARSPEDLLFRRELEQWQGRPYLEVEVIVGKATGRWHGHVGIVTTLIPSARFDPWYTFAFICGPELMMRFTVMELEKRGVSQERIYISMERNMKCAVGFCGHCQFGPTFVCKDGPIFRYGRLQPFLGIREV